MISWRLLRERPSKNRPTVRKYGLWKSYINVLLANIHHNSSSRRVIGFIALLSEETQ